MRLSNLLNFIFKVLKPSTPRAFFCFLLISFSCSSPKQLTDVAINPIKQESYEKHVSATIDQFLLNNQKMVISVNKNLTDYMQGIVQSIRINNELFFKKNSTISFIFLESHLPLYFSSPNGKIVITSGLVKKYIKTEELFAAILTQELIRIEKGLYKAIRSVPTGSEELGSALSYSKLSPEDSLELYKWTYLVLRRSGRDAIAVLNVLQTQNKNNLDFALMIDDGRVLSGIERRFKSFLVTNENIGNIPKYSNVQNKKFAILTAALEQR